MVSPRPRSSWTVRMSWPSSSRWVTKECRKVWQLTRLAMPARRVAAPGKPQLGRSGRADLTDRANCRPRFSEGHRVRERPSRPRDQHTQPPLPWAGLPPVRSRRATRIYGVESHTAGAPKPTSDGRAWARGRGCRGRYAPRRSRARISRGSRLPCTHARTTTRLSNGRYQSTYGNRRKRSRRAPR